MKKNLKVQRHELKFYISLADYNYCQHVLKHLLQTDEFQTGENGYFIRSLYFEDVAESSVEEKLDGIETRDKYRLRIYDCGQDWAKLERKRKDNSFVNKSSVTISKQEALAMMDGDYDFLLNKEGPAAKSIYFDLKRKYFRPVVIVDYIRDVYKMDYNEIRITFDKQIRTTTSDLNLFDENVLTQPLQRDDVIIMEVKFNTCLPSWFKDFLNFESHVSMAISKYCYGRMNTREFYSTTPKPALT